MTSALGRDQCSRQTRRRVILFVCVFVLAVVATGCGDNESADETTTSEASTPATASSDDTTASTGGFDGEPADGPLSLNVEESAEPATCEPPEGDTVRCTAIIENTTDQSGQVVTDVAFYDASDVRVATDSRFETYVAAGQRYIEEFYGPADTIRAEVLAVTWEFPEEPVTGAPVPEESGALFLPIDQAVRSTTCQPGYDGGLECEIEIVNLSDSTTEIDTTVAFLDSTRLRVSTDTRFQEAVAPGEAFRQTFFGDPGATTAEVYEVVAVAG